MVNRTLSIARNELAEAIAEYAIRPKEGEFLLVPLGDGNVAKIHPYPLRASRPIRVGNFDYVDNHGAVVRLTAPEDFAVLASLSTPDLPLRHVYLGEQLAAAYSDEGEEFKNKVQVQYWTRTGQIIWKNNDDAVRKVLSLVPTSETSADAQLITADRASPNGYKSVVITVPTKTGYFNSLSGPIPTDGDIMTSRPDGRVGRWNGNYPDKNGLSAVGCLWLSVGERLYADAGLPLYWNDVGVLGMATDAPLNK